MQVLIKKKKATGIQVFYDANTCVTVAVLFYTIIELTRIKRINIKMIHISYLCIHLFFNILYTYTESLLETKYQMF